MLPWASRDVECQKLLADWSREPFDLSNGPLLRVRLIRLTENKHVLGLFLHHIICDGPSIQVLFDELAEYYAGNFARPHLDVQFSDYAAWEQQQRPDEENLDWWRNYLADVPTVLELASDRPRPSVREISGSAHIFTLASSLIKDASTLGRSLHASPFMVIMAAYASLLGRLTGATDILVGTPISNRPFPELESLIGFFVNTLPVRVDLSGNPSFRDLVGRVRDSVLDVLDHAQVPFEQLVEMLQIPRDPSGTPLIQALFTFEETKWAEPRFEGLDARLVALPPAAAKFDLDFMVVQAPGNSGEFEVTITYAEELFDPASAERWGCWFKRILDAGITHPMAPLSSISLLDDGERRIAVGGGNGLPSKEIMLPVHDLFTVQAKSAPDAPAIDFNGVTLSYAHLDAQSDAVARRLREAGVRSGDVVGVLIPRSIAMVTALLGTLKAGAAYLPLDPRHSTEQIAQLLARAGSRLALTVAECAPRLAGSMVTAVHLDELDVARGPSTVGSWPPVHPESLAYVIFTSGSTGEPKGVAVPHSALANHAQAMRKTLNLDSDDRMLQFANVGFDVAAEEIFPTLLAGGCVVLCPDPPAPEDLTNSLNAGAVTVVNLPSSYWQAWSARLDPAKPFPVPSLRLSIVGSESVDAGALATWCGWTGVPVLNAYGLTETAITSLVYAVEKDFSGSVVPVGLPIDGVRSYVLGANLELLPPGIPGELYIGGVGLARGYLGHPDLTAERFVPDPFAGSGARMHRTGDRARRRADGAVEVLGRMDDQIKVNGYRIEPRQVETALAEHPGILQAAAAARSGPGGTQRLVGYVVTRDSGGVPADLRAHLFRCLPSYMVPGMLVALPALPLTASGKVDRTALPEPTMPHRDQATVPAQTELERELAAIWRKNLLIDEVGIHDNFFDLGGSSFALAKVHAQLVEVLEDRITLVTLYEYPTIAALAQHLSNHGDGRDNTSAPSVPARAAQLRAGRNRLDRRRAGR